MSSKKNVNRRQFLKSAACAGIAITGFPYFVPSSALGKNSSIAPSEKITIGSIGTGWQGTANLQTMIQEKAAHFAAICDIDRNHLNDTVDIVNATYGNKDCAAYHDYRELLARDDIDAVILSVPDHWHGIVAVAAAKAGKDIYGEKPLSHSFAEGRAICQAVEHYGRVWQTGSWQRSESNFRFACELVRNEYIGKVHTVEVILPSGHYDYAGTKGQETLGPPPVELDYNFWLGPAPYAPYCPARVHKNWRWHLDYGGGALMDWIGHHCDIAHWGLDLDNTGPIEIEGRGEYPKTGLWNSPVRYCLTAKYRNDITMTIASDDKETSIKMKSQFRGGTKWIGDKGWVWVNRGVIDAQPKELLNVTIGPNEIHLFNSPGHSTDFINCIKNRQKTITTCETAHRSATPGHLSMIAMWLGRKIRFNPDTEEIIDDPIASRMLSNAYRSPWSL